MKIKYQDRVSENISLFIVILDFLRGFRGDFLNEFDIRNLFFGIFIESIDQILKIFICDVHIIFLHYLSQLFQCQYFFCLKNFTS